MHRTANTRRFFELESYAADYANLSSVAADSSPVAAEGAKGEGAKEEATAPRQFAARRSLVRRLELRKQKTVSVTISGIYFIFPLMVTDTVFC
jgi:hypothetical protein